MTVSVLAPGPLLTFAQCLVPQQFEAPSFVTGATFVGMGVLAAWVARQDRFAGRLPFLLSLAAILWWLACAFMEFSTNNLSCKWYFSQSAWIGIAGVAISWATFIYCYCIGQNHHFFRIFRGIALIGFCIVSLNTILAPYHGMLYGPGTHLEIRDGYVAIVHERGSLYYVSAVILYLFMIVALVLLAIASFRARSDHRPYMFMMLFGTSIPTIFNFVYIVYGFTIFGRDPTPFTFSFVLLVLTWAVFTNRMFDLSARARDLAFFGSVDPVLIFDARGALLSINDAGRRLFWTTANRKAAALLALDQPIRALLTGQSGTEGQRISFGVEEAHFDARLVPVNPPLGAQELPLGVVVFLQDVTAAKDRETRLTAALDSSQGQLTELTRLRDEAERSALLDPLTGLPNRRALAVAFDTLASADNLHDVLAVVDLDHFKAVNDEFGHIVGDEILRLFAFELADALPSGAFAFRVGGEEFLVLWPNHGASEMAAVLQRLAAALAQGLDLPTAFNSRIKFSAGIASRPYDASSLDRLYEIADARLYRAKRAGRNRLIADDRDSVAESRILMDDKRERATIQHNLMRFLADVPEPRLLRGQRLLVPLEHAILSAPLASLNSAIDAAIAVLGELCAADRVSVFRLTDMVARQTHEWIAPDVTALIEQLQSVPRDLFAPWMPALVADEAVHIHDTTVLPANDPVRILLDAHGVRTVLGVPILEDDLLIGLVVLAGVPERRPFDATDIALVRMVAGVLALAQSSKHEPANQRPAGAAAAESLKPLALTMNAAGGLVRADPALEALLDVSSNSLQEQSLAVVLHALQEKAGLTVPAAFADLVDEAGKSDGWAHECLPLVTADGRLTAVLSIERPVPDVPLIALTPTQARRMAHEDPLTGLANRRALQEAALQELARSAAAGREFALMLLDLDNFKSVNDMLRHERGDYVIQCVAERLRVALETRGMVARMGGDEFMILAPALDEASAKELAEELRALIAAPMDVGSHIVNVTASVGIALYPAHGKELPHLVTSADIALFAAKREGRNCAVVVSQDLFKAEERRSTIAQALGSASLNESLTLYYQPQFAAASPITLVGAESLLRWRHPVLGEIGPGEFVPIAEQMGAIHRIDEFVLSEAIEQLAKWQRRGWSHRLSVNMSAQSLTRSDFADNVLSQLATFGVDPSGLTIEITETMLVALSEVAERNASRLKSQGVAIAIDDFGTGYGSLAYLQRLDVSEIKIDRIFVEGLERPGQRDSEELIRAMVSMAHALRVTVIAEGVQTEVQRNWLVSVGCERIQGALTGSAMTVLEFEAAYLQKEVIP